MDRSGERRKLLLYGMTRVPRRRSGTYRARLPGDLLPGPMCGGNASLVADVAYSGAVHVVLEVFKSGPFKYIAFILAETVSRTEKGR